MPDHDDQWVTTSKGRTEITLTITVDGKRVVLGTVAVVVR